jgi:hypothetical protein
MKIFIYYFTVLCFAINILLLPLPARAGEVITQVNVGDPAPFSGTLLNPEAAARILVDLENNESSCQIIVDTELGRQLAAHQLALAHVQFSLDACTTRYDNTLLIKNNQIDFLETQLQKPKIFTKEVTFVLGVVAGITLTAVAGYTMGQVAGN